MPESWNWTHLSTMDDVVHALTEAKGKRWLCRGQSKRYRALTPSIDRPPLDSLSRAEKLVLERRSIDLFRSTARYFADPGEQGALADDAVALTVLRHYDVPSRILDWSWSPWVATYFAVEKHDSDDGEIWMFDEPLYERRGTEQWRRWPETTTDGSGDRSKWAGVGQTAFTLEEPPDWFICGFYTTGFHRQNAQQSVYSMTARFGRDHAAKISEVLKDPLRHHGYLVDATLKPKLREFLREMHGVWRGSLFPDSAGAAETAKSVFSNGV